MVRPRSEIALIYGMDSTIPFAHQPWHVDGWHAYAHHCEAQDDHDAAISAYSQAIEIAHRYHPIIHFDHAALHYQHALILHALGRTEEAHHALHQAIFQDHQHQPALYVQQHGWDNAPAFAAYHAPFACYVDKWQQIARCPSLPLPAYYVQHDAWVRAYHAQHLEEAHAISAVLEDASLCASGWLYRSLMHAHHGLWDAAKEAIHHALTLHSAHHKLYHYGASLHYLDRARCFAVQRNYPLAYMDAIRAHDIDVTHAEAKQFLLEVQLMLGSF
jgi:hypothetical protein